MHHSGPDLRGSYALRVTNIASTSELATTRDGLTQLRRHWPAENPRAALLLVHGIGEHCGRYEHVGSFLASAGIDVVGFDNRGFGQSGGRRAHVDAFSEFLDDIEDLLVERRKLGVPVILLGHSLGGLMSATYLVSNRPQPDLGVLSAPALAADLPRWQRVMAAILGRIAPKVFIKTTIEGELLSRDEAVGTKYKNDPLVIAGSTGGLGYHSLAAMKSTTESISAIKVPTYVLHGSADALVPLSASDCIADLDNATRRVWDDLRHECFNEPEQIEVMAEMLAWIDGKLA